ncbi:MAG: hypothetical protein WD904_03095 [Dehalococcoidia bacterium]
MVRIRRSNPISNAGAQRERFSQYFPRLFAYVYGLTGDEEASKEATIGAFATVVREDYVADDDFAVFVFTAARTLIRNRRSPSRDGLTSREQEVVSLLFDAQLSRTEIARLLELEPEAVTSSLVTGLKKLQGAPRTAPPTLQPLSV